MTEIKPCPFCGGEAEVRAYTLTLQFVQCKVCNASSTAFPNNEDAIKSWNRRYNLIGILKAYYRKILTALLNKIDKGKPLTTPSIQYIKEDNGHD